MTLSKINEISVEEFGAVLTDLDATAACWLAETIFYTTGIDAFPVLSEARQKVGKFTISPSYRMRSAWDFEAKAALDALLEDGSWTRDGAIALTDYLGIQDVPAQAVNVSFLADNWVEYSSSLEAAAEHGHTASDEDDALDWLRARTRVISFDSGVIVVNF